MTNTQHRFDFIQSPMIPAEARNAMIAMSEFQTEAVKTALRFQIEALSFMQKRIAKDAELFGALAASAEHGDTYDVCVDFYREAMNDYTSEVGRLARIESEAAAETAELVERETAAMVDDMATQTAA